jgi:hypothetical protein
MLARILAVAALTCAIAAAGAQTPVQPPANRGAAPPPTYQSAYEGYRPYVEEPLAPWREVNDTVERVGGHAGVLRDEARTPPPSAPPATLPATAPKGAGHDAHHRK